MEHKVFWAIRFLNFYLVKASIKRLLQLNKLEEFRMDAYVNAKFYNKRNKRWHKKYLRKKEFKEGDLVLLFNSRLKFFLGKLKSRWSGPFKIKQFFHYGVVELLTKDNGTFKVNGKRLKPYHL